MTSDHQSRQRRRLTATVTDLDVVRQKAFLVGVQLSDTTTGEADRSLEELALLADTAGSDPIDMELVRRPYPDPATFIGSGKIHELVGLTDALDIDVVVFDNDLTPAQQRNLQKLFGCDVVDREALILDIFAQHATSREGSVQVELALLRYHYPRLRGKGRSLSQQGGGIGTRGPGETKLETDRRRIQARMSKLEKELATLAKNRATQRKARQRSEIPQAAIVGYTNAGKSTLLNHLTLAEVVTEDRLFSTLDSTVRRCTLPDGRFLLLSDTVGFVRRLPHQLIEAFRSTLDEVREAAVLVHLVDASDPDADGQIAAVRTVLTDIGANDIPELLAFNKVDIADPVAVGRLQRLHPDAVAISALTGEGVEHMLGAIADLLKRQTRLLRLTIPYDRGDVVATAHRVGEVVAEKHDDSGTLLEVRVTLDHEDRFKEFLA